MKRIFAVLALTASLGAGLVQAGSNKIDGWISDSMCGAKHLGDKPDCVKQCIQSMGAKPVFVDAAKKTVWAIDNPESVKSFLGNHVTITAVLDEGKKSIHIEAVEAAN